jgi:hypothetical protein
MYNGVIRREIDKEKYRKNIRIEENEIKREMDRDL